MKSLQLFKSFLILIFLMALPIIITQFFVLKKVAVAPGSPTYEKNNWHHRPSRILIRDGDHLAIPQEHFTKSLPYHFVLTYAQDENNRLPETIKEQLAFFKKESGQYLLVAGQDFLLEPSKKVLINFLETYQYEEETNLILFPLHFSLKSLLKGLLADTSFSHLNFQGLEISPFTSKKNWLIFKIKCPTSKHQLTLYFRPYTPSPSFQKKIYKPEVDGSRGIFTHGPFSPKNNQAPHYYAFKQNFLKPLVLELDPQIPPYYLGAVKEGILYWNKALGKRKVFIKMLERGKVNKDDVLPNSFQVHWVENLGAAKFLATDLRTDPLTGEILGATLYLSSLFSFGDFHSVKKVLKEATSAVGEFHYFDPGNEFIKDLEALMHTHEQRLLRKDKQPNISGTINEHLSKLSKDYLRYAVAHESGHIMGASHNFAGHLASPLSHEKWQKITTDYLRTGHLPTNLLLSSTVMDYLPLLPAAMVGHQIQKLSTPLPYDEQTMNWLYSKENNQEAIKKMAPSSSHKILPFCNEKHYQSGYYVDCQKWASTNNPILWAHELWTKRLQSLPEKLMLHFSFLSKGSQNLRINEIKNITLRPERDAEEIIKAYSSMAYMMVSDAHFISLVDPLDTQIGIIKDDQAHLEFQKKCISPLGGMAKALFGSLISIDKNKCKQSGSILIFKNLKIEFLELTKKLFFQTTKINELKEVQSKMRDYFYRFEVSLLGGIFKILTKANFIHVEQKEYCQFLRKFVKKILFTKTKKVLGRINGNGIFEYYYPENLRRQTALALLELDPYSNNLHQSNLKEKVIKKILSYHEKNPCHQGPDLNSLPSSLFNWCYSENMLFLPLENYLKKSKLKKN